MSSSRSYKSYLSDEKCFKINQNTYSQLAVNAGAWTGEAAILCNLILLQKYLSNICRWIQNLSASSVLSEELHWWHLRPLLGLAKRTKGVKRGSRGSRTPAPPILGQISEKFSFSKLIFSPGDKKSEECSEFKISFHPVAQFLSLVTSDPSSTDKLLSPAWKQNKFTLLVSIRT